MIKIARHTDCGGREVNEDTCCFYKNANGLCAVIADGLGGHGGGEQASRKAAEIIGQQFAKQTAIIPADLNTWFQDANKAVVGLQSDKCRMKTTLVTLCVNEKEAVWAHVGDSRLYHFADRKLEFVTFDHSVTQMAVLSGEISRKDMRHHVDRNKLLRTIGKTDILKVELSDICDVSHGTHEFLMCSDGFWEYVEESEMEATLTAAETPKGWLEAMEQILEGRIDGHNDNNTASAVWVMHP